MKRGVVHGSTRAPYITGTAMTFSEIGAALGVTGAAASLAFWSGMRKLQSKTGRDRDAIVALLRLLDGTPDSHSISHRTGMGAARAT